MFDTLFCLRPCPHHQEQGRRVLLYRRVKSLIGFCLLQQSLVNTKRQFELNKQILFFRMRIFCAFLLSRTRHIECGGHNYQGLFSICAYLEQFKMGVYCLYKRNYSILQKTMKCILIPRYLRVLLSLTINSQQL